MGAEFERGTRFGETSVVAVNEAEYLGKIIEKGYFGSVDRRGPHVFVEWPDEPDWHLLRKMSALRLRLEDIFLAPVKIVNAGRGCFYAHYTFVPDDIDSFLIANSMSRNDRWPIIRAKLVETKIRFRVSKLQYIANFEKRTIR